MGITLPFKIELKELETPGLRGRKSVCHQYLFAFRHGPNIAFRAALCTLPIENRRKHRDERRLSSVSGRAPFFLSRHIKTLMSSPKWLA